MSALPSAIAAERAAEDGKPKVTFRHAGDRFLLVEYGEMEFDLQLNFRVLTANAALQQRGLDGLVDTGPGLRSNLIRYDPALLEPGRLIDVLNAVEDEVPAGGGLKIPSRVIHLPIAFDDSKSREAVERYMRSVRADAPNVEGANNVDYIVRYNGLADREALYEEVLATEWWNAFTGFFPGLPFMYPLDPRYAVFAPKYNPTRTWTAEGAVGLGGPCVAIYPVESPGGYQLFGRTLPIYDLAGRNAAFRPDPILIKPGDRVTFHRVTEEELDAAREAVRADRYEYRVEEDPFDVEDWMRHCDDVAEEAGEHRRRREVASEGTPVP